MKMSKVSEETRKLVDEMKLNVKLLAKNEVPEENIFLMKKEYDKLKELFSDAAELEESNEMGEISSFIYKKLAQSIGRELEQVENRLQKLWNFEENSDFYTYWNLLPGCECPKDDNKERYGYGRIINCECPYHSFLCKNLNKNLEK